MLIDNDTNINEINKHELLLGKLWHFVQDSNEKVVDPGVIMGDKQGDQPNQ